jgi:hypothetical protein
MESEMTETGIEAYDVVVATAFPVAVYVPVLAYLHPVVF